jgi:PAS domain S-box-containing protein
VEGAAQFWESNPDVIFAASLSNEQEHFSNNFNYVDLSVLSGHWVQPPFCLLGCLQVLGYHPHRQQPINAKPCRSSRLTAIPAALRGTAIGIVALVLYCWSSNAQGLPRRILLLYPYDNEVPATAIAGAAIRKRLIEKSRPKIDVGAEFLDLARFPKESDELRSAHYLAEKYAGRLPEIIMPMNLEGLRFATKYRDIIAPNVPIVFCCVPPQIATAADRPNDVTGVYTQFDVGKTIELARQLQPDARNLVIVSGSSDIDRRYLDAMREEIEPYGKILNTEYWIGIPYVSLLDRASRLPRETIVVFITVYDDSTGRVLFPAKVVEALAQASSAPVYGPSDTYLGLGVVGGYVDSFESMGVAAADLALEVLDGTSPTTIGPRPSQNRKFRVDARQLIRWKIPEKYLPTDAVLSFKQATMWEEHRNVVLATALVILLQTIMISALLAQMFARRRAETSLKESEERWRSVFEMSTVGIALADDDFRFIATNTAVQTMLGRTGAELRGLSPLDICVDEDRESLKLLFEQVREGQQQSYEAVQQYRHRNGAPIWVQAYVSRMQGDKSKRPLFLATTIDIPGRKRAEAASRDALSELARVGRLATMGEMTASIAHEINQPLGAIVTDGSAGLRWLANATPDLEEARVCLKRIVSDGHRASQVISSIRNMITKGSGIKESLNVNELAREVLAFAHGEIESKRILVQTELTEDLSEVLVDRIQLQQVVLNLVMNGIDAMASLRGRARVLRLRSEQNGPANVSLTVEDTGTGIDKSINGRIFEAFFTTKERGMGMGLSICRSIVVAHGGRLSVSPGYPDGSAFRLELPVFRPGAE